MPVYKPHLCLHPYFLNLVCEDNVTTVTLNYEMKGSLFTLHGLWGLSSPSVKNFWDSGLEETVDTLLSVTKVYQVSKSMLKPGEETTQVSTVNNIIIMEKRRATRTRPQRGSKTKNNN